MAKIILHFLTGCSWYCSGNLIDEQNDSQPNCLDILGNFKSESHGSHDLHNNVKYSFSLHKAVVLPRKIFHFLLQNCTYNSAPNFDIHVLLIGKNISISASFYHKTDLHKLTCRVLCLQLEKKFHRCGIDREIFLNKAETMDACSQDILSHIWQHLEYGMEGGVSYVELFLDALVVWNAAHSPHCLQMATENQETYSNVYNPRPQCRFLPVVRLQPTAAGTYCFGKCVAFRGQFYYNSREVLCFPWPYPPQEHATLSTAQSGLLRQAPCSDMQMIM